MFIVSLFLFLSFAPIPLSAGILDVFMSEETVFLKACDEVIETQLKSPSTYKRISVKFFSHETATLKKHMGWDSGTRDKELFEKFENDPEGFDGVKRHFSYMDETGIAAVHYLFDRHVRDKKRWREGDKMQVAEAVFSYDAANSYGTLIRDSAICEFTYWPSDGDLKQVLNSMPLRINVNGKNKLGY